MILVTGHGDITMAVRAMRGGAYDFLAKPYPAETLVASVRRALEQEGDPTDPAQRRSHLASINAKGRLALDLTVGTTYVPGRAEFSHPRTLFTSGGVRFTMRPLTEAQLASLALVALGAMLIPARRAASVNPASALQ